MSTESQPAGGGFARDELGRPLPGASTLSGEWHPTEYQVKALEYVLLKECHFTIKAMAKAIGMEPNNWTYWRKIPGFVAWWRQNLDEYMHDQLPVIMATLLKIAKGGKVATRMQVAAAKLIMERYDRAYIPRSRADVNVKGELKLGVGNSKLEAIFDQIASRFPKQRALAQDPAAEHAGEEEDSPGRLE